MKMEKARFYKFVIQINANYIIFQYRKQMIKIRKMKHYCTILPLISHNGFAIVALCINLTTS